MIEGGPCTHCGATQASIWYGKRDKEKYCKRSECMRAGGYLAPKLTKAMKRRRVQTELTPVKLEAETYSLEATIEELIDIYGQRCAALSNPPALPSCPPARSR